MADTGDITIHMIGHGHIDPTWLWRWTEGYEEVRATFRSALDRMRETPEFKFTASSACFYRWMQEAEPKLFEELRARVREGRWEVAGGMWVEPDCNLPCGESFVRHGLYSQRYFEKEVGARARVGFNPDSFGHAGTLPQILKKLGIDFYVFMRPEPGREMGFPEGTTFWWTAPDGSRILASKLPEDYVGTEVLPRIRRLPAHPHLNRGQQHILCFYGVGNHGGGPTKKAIRDILDAQKDPALPKVRFSTLLGHFEGWLECTEEEAIPVIADELQYHARGCYSAHAEMKRRHRQVEHALMTAERFAAAAWLLNAKDYPHDQFDKAWKDLLYNQFHDILAGTSLCSSYEDTFDQLGAARHRAHVIVNQAVQSIARDVDTAAGGNAIVVFNPLTWDVAQTVTVQPIIARGLEAPIHLVDDEGMQVPLQRVRHERPGACRYAFTADVPAAGYRCYYARSGGEPHKWLRRLDANRTSLENDWWHIEFDPEEGHITRITDKAHGVNVMKRGGVLAAMTDASDTWSHDVAAYRVEAGRFGDARLRLVEQGDVFATIQVTTSWGRSTAIQEYTIYRDLDDIDCLLRVNWQEQYCALKLAYETAVEGARATYEAPYGHQARPQSGNEEPGQQWFDLSGTLGGLTYGFAILNDGAYAYDALDGVMRVTVLRSPAYAHHDPARFSAGEALPIMDQGWHTLRLRLVPHLGPWQESRIVKRAWELNVPLIAHNESAHPGTRRMRAQLVGTEAENVLITVIKQSEEGEELVVRGYETAGRPASTRLHLPYWDKVFQLEFAPHEIKTVRISPRDWTLREVNLLEE